MGAGQADAGGGLKPPDLKLLAKPDRGGVATAEES
jgi:hypothetical protein